MVKGKFDFRDLDKDSQYYYDKLIKYINEFVTITYIQNLMVEDLDKLIELLKGGDN